MTTAAQDEYNELFRDKSRRTAHPEDDDDGSPNSPHPSDSDSDSKPEPVSPSNNLPSRDFVPTRKAYSNTGPKGVIADAQAFEAARREQQRAGKPLATAYEYTPDMAQLGLDGRRGSSGSDDSEDDFMAQWRQSRLAELSQGGNRNSGAAGGRAQQLYGTVVGVDGDGYLDAVDRSPAGTVVVVFIFDDQSEVSFLVEDCLKQLARKHKTTRFVKLHHRDAEMEPAGVPAVLAYRGGDKFAGLVPVVDEIADDADLSAVSLENLFQKHQIL